MYLWTVAYCSAATINDGASLSSTIDSRLRLHPKQSIPADSLVENIHCIPTIVVGGLQRGDRIEKHAQRFGGVRSAVHLPLLLSVVGLREQLTHQLDEHRHRIVRELLAKLDDLSHNQSVATAGIEVVGKPGRGCVTLPDHLAPPSC